ncbi:hypothetical protein LG307_14730 [Sutcliffiella horikoshii]|uniref:hypothetical protein n=1 Tax=Sutcliffiella horikoshii TaxID=79883 RepID=UPI00385171F3
MKKSGLIEFFETIGAINQKVTEWSNAISKSIQPLVELSIKFQEWISSDEMQQTFKNIIEGIEQTEEDINNYKKAMLILGYPPNISLDIILMREIGREFLENNTDNLEVSIDEIMKNYYNPTLLNEIKRDWESYNFLTDRLPLLRQAINAHNLGMYALSIPSIITQMEGLIIQGYDIKQRVSGKQFRKLVSALFVNDEEESFNFDNEVGDFYLKFILVNFDHGTEITSEVSRHAILHGGAKPSLYAREEVSLKIILMMDNIIHRINDLKPEEVQATKEKLGFNASLILEAK